MTKKTLAGILAVGMILSSNMVFAASNYQFEQQTPQYTPYNYSQTQNYGYTPQYMPNTQIAALQGSVSMIPAGTNFKAVSTSEISTKTLSLGQSVAFALANPFYYNGKLIAPVGSQVMGNVIYLRKVGMAGKNGQLQIRFTNILTPTGQNILISGKIKTTDGTGILKGGTAKDTTKDYVKDTAIGAASGAILGTALGAMAGGSVGKGAIYGTALGGGLGVGKSVIDKGADVSIPANSTIDIVIDQPITVSSSSKY